MRLLVQAAQEDLLYQWEHWSLYSHYLVEDYETQISGLNDEIDVLSESLEAALEPDSWYETTEFWFAVGLVAGSGATVAIVALVD